jgi:hypothetical protein
MIEAIRKAEDAARELIKRAMRDGADLTDVGAAAAAVHVVGMLRRKCGRSGPDQEDIERERLAELSRRRVELANGDIAAAAATATLITKRPVPEVGEGD